MSSSPTVLIFTYPEHGQANVSLATAYELALAGVNVHIASFASLSTRVSHLQELVLRHASRSGSEHTGSVFFQECKGVIPWEEALNRHGIEVPNLSHPMGVSGALRSYSSIDVILFPWNKEEHRANIEIYKEMITVTVKPDLVVVDFLFDSAQDACKLAGQKFMVLMPNSMKEYALPMQPYLAGLWKYPIISSGFPFPLKWWQVPFNIYLSIHLIRHMSSSVRCKEISALRRSFGFNYLIGDTSTRCFRGVRHMCTALVETDFPFAVIPKELIPCGPILLPFDPLEESDPSLMKWLDNGPTVMVSLGTHVRSNATVAREMASAFRILLDYHNQNTSTIQVLWKVKAKGDIQAVIEEVIGKEIKEGKVKVLPWLEAEPISILQHPNLVCTVHHGGASSFNEGVWSGVPHIVLPVWLDTFDYARRVEYLNIGVFGSKTCAPDARADEFGKALVRLTGNTEEAARFRASAKHLKEVCRAKGNGRELACAAILEEAGIRK